MLSETAVPMLMNICYLKAPYKMYVFSSYSRIVAHNKNLLYVVGIRYNSLFVQICLFVCFK